MDKPRFVIIDGSSYFYRAFYAIKFLSNSKGFPTNAIYGFTRMLLKVINQERPDYLAIAFDVKAPTFRHVHYEQYKATRSPMPDTLAQQIPYIKQIVDAFNIPGFEMPGFEADDIIGTMAKKAENEGLETLIVSGDKDTWQLINENVKVVDELRGEYYDENSVEVKTGLKPYQILDAMALAGDSSDNIPGVPGIGMKTAVNLVKEFGNLDNLLSNLGQINGKLRKTNLSAYTDQIHLSRKLAEIDKNVPIQPDWEKLKYSPPDYKKTAKIFKELELFSLMDQLGTNLFEQSEIEANIIINEEQLKEIVKILSSVERFSFYLIAAFNELEGVAVSIEPGKAYYIPVEEEDYSGVPMQLEKNTVLRELKLVLENSAVKKSVSDIKANFVILNRYGINLAGADFDPLLAAYILNSSRNNNRSLGDIVVEELNRKLTIEELLAGKDCKPDLFKNMDISEAANLGAEASEAIFQLTDILSRKLKEAGLEKLLSDIEIPLSLVLAQMEITGILIDVKQLEDMSKQLDGQLKTLTSRIHFLAGEQFNMDSPKQLGYILFERLGLPTLKKNKTGYSTNVDVLEELALFHPLPAEILEYRKLRKLKSGYVDALPQLVDSDTKRLHTSFNQTITATGRLSSSDPNLQNIPVRGELANQLRRTFIPQEGYKFLAADYSQIELRLVAHIAQEEDLIKAFAEGKDIHQITASEVFQVSLDSVTPELRRRAKAINFGILYGMSAFGLSKEIKVGQKEAQKYIENYFAKYPKIDFFIKDVISRAKQDGYTATLFGRRRYIPELQAKDKPTRLLGERMAINSPIQGSSADIIKMAMIAIQKRIDRNNLKSRLILQVHDELILEVPEEEIENAAKMVKEEMEGVVSLRAPLEVKISTGQSWAVV